MNARSLRYFNSPFSTVGVELLHLRGDGEFNSHFLKKRSKSQGPLQKVLNTILAAKGFLIF
jgi:hypothetical protein